MINRDINSLDPRYRQRFKDYLQELERTFPQFKVIITETRRSAERQKDLVKSGASKTLYSNHQDGTAMDIALQRKSTGTIDWRPAVYRNVYRVVDPREFGLTTGAHLWGWDEGHHQIIESQGRGRNLPPFPETYEH